MWAEFRRGGERGSDSNRGKSETGGVISWACWQCVEGGNYTPHGFGDDLPTSGPETRRR